MENPTHSKFWSQPFMSEIEAAVNTKFNGRSFLLNRCRVGGTHFKQFELYTSLPPHATKHMELTCNHHFKHPPCLGRDANGNSVTKASGVYTRSMIFMIVACVGLLTGLKKTLSQVSEHVHCAHATLHKNHRVDFCLNETTTFKYLRGVCRHSNDLDRFGPVIRCCGFPRVDRASNRIHAREESRAHTSEGEHQCNNALMHKLNATCVPSRHDTCVNEGFCRPRDAFDRPMTFVEPNRTTYAH